MFYNPKLTDEHYRALGRIAVYSSALEFSLKYSIGIIGFGNALIGLSVFANSNFSKMSDLLRKLADAKLNEEGRKAFLAILDLACQYMGERDINMHRLWDFDEKTGTIIGRKLKGKPKHGDLYTEVSYDINDIDTFNKLADNITETTELLYKFIILHYNEIKKANTETKS